MDFTPTDEQRMLADTARSLFAKEFPSSLLRDAVYDPTPDGPAAAEAAFDRHVRDWFALGDGPAVDLCLFLEPAGAAVLTGPLWSTTALCLPLLRAVGHPDAEAMAAGELTGTVAVAGADGHWVPNADPTKFLVPDAARAQRIAVVDATPAGTTVEVLGPEQVGLSEVANLDRSRPLFEVTRPGGPGSAAEPVALDPAAFAQVLARATVALAAELVGVAGWLREATLAYVSERVQFGVPVGSFQGLQWKLVDAALVHERALAAVHYAAMCLDADDPDAADAVHVAKAAAGTAARRWGADGLQAHGGIGYTWEHDLHLRLRRAQAGDRLLGDAAWHHDRLADLLFDAPPTPGDPDTDTSTGDTT